MGISFPLADTRASGDPSLRIWMLNHTNSLAAPWAMARGFLTSSAAATQVTSGMTESFRF